MSLIDKKHNKKHITFGLAFITLGILVAALKLSPRVLERIHMAWWMPVQATLIGVVLESQPDHRGLTRLNIEAKYTYTFNKTQYISSRVTERFHPQQLGKQLMQDFSSNTPITIWLDPQNPDNSIIDKSAAEGIALLLGVCVLLFTAGILFIALAKTEETNAVSASIVTHARLHNSDWTSNRIKPRQFNGLIISILVAVIYNAIFLSVYASVFYVIADGNLISILGLIFPTIGVALSTWAVRNIIEFLKFGGCTLEMSPFPGAIGGYFGARVNIPMRADQAISLAIHLSCIKNLRGGVRIKAENNLILWCSENSVVIKPGTNDRSLHFRIRLPAKLPASDLNHHANSYVWLLELRAQPDFYRSYVVPVYPNEDSNTPPNSTHEINLMNN